MKLRSVGIVAGLGGLLVTGTAMAQDPGYAPAEPAPALPPASEPAPAPAPAPQAEAQAGGQAQVGMALPGAGPAAAAPGTTDHDAVIGRLAVGYLGRRSMTISTSSTTAAQGTVPFEAPIVGVRYWIDQLLGLDLGVGLSISGGSTEVSPPPPPPAPSTLDLQGYTVFMAHAGVPLALASGRHYSFQLVPEVNFGIASSSIETAGVETRFSGLHFDIGMRAGAEIQFGFINIPELSLQAGVGLGFAMDSTTGTTEASPANPQELSFDVRTNRFATSVGDNPWNIFTSNIAALYYF
jgi:hypothetical protein